MTHERNSGLDILRIFATIQVILFHIYLTYGYSQKSTNFFFIFFCVLSKTNNFHFMLISSFAGCTSHYYLSKSLPLILSTLFYSIFDYFNAISFFKFKNFNLLDLCDVLFPLAKGEYFWYIFPFLVSQFILSLIYPTLEQTNRKYYFTICILFIFLYCFPKVGLYKLSGLGNQYSVGPFMCMSFIGSYMRYHYKNKIENFKLIIIYIVLFSYNFFIHKNHNLNIKQWFLIKILSQTWIMNFPSLIFSLPLFLISLSYNSPFKYSHLLQHLAESSMGIYLLHCSNFHMMYWNPIAKLFFINLNNHFIYVWKFVLKIYFIGVIVEIIRQHLFKSLLFNRNYYQTFTKKFNYYLMGM